MNWEAGGSGLILSILQEFSWMAWGNPYKPSVMLPGLRALIRTEDFPSTKQKWQPFARDVRYQFVFAFNFCTVVCASFSTSNN
jgi:hypothetical protein